MVLTAAIEEHVKRYTIELPPIVHARMRELARRKRVQIGVVYEEAIRMFLERPENFMGRAKQIKKGRLA